MNLRYWVTGLLCVLLVSCSTIETHSPTNANNTTPEPLQTSKANTENSRVLDAPYKDLEEYIETKFSEGFGYATVDDDFPLTVPPYHAVQIPSAMGYDKRLLNAVIQTENHLIGVVYSYREWAGGGTYTYASQYGWKLTHQIGVVYEFAEGALCEHGAELVMQITELASDGIFALTIDQEVIAWDEYESINCIP